MMIKRWVLLTLCLCNLLCADPIRDRKVEDKALSQLASELGISSDKDIIEETQKRWLRGPTRERWELNEISQEQRLFVLNWAKEQGMYDAWTPSSDMYDKALILGATTRNMQMRLNYLKELWIQGVRFDEVVWLTGERPLDRRIDGLTDRCNTESESARLIWAEADLPEEMRQLRVVFVEVPMKVDGEKLKRPNTEDTIVAWLKISQEPCKLLFVSDQPFCGYQFAVVKASLPRSYTFDLVGEGVDPSSHPAAAAITLDSIARWIYQESVL